MGKQNSICTLVLRQLTSNRERLSATGSPWICTFPPPLSTTSNQVKSSQSGYAIDGGTIGHKRLQVVAETGSLLLIFHCYFLQYNAAGELGEKDLSCSDLVCFALFISLFKKFCLFEK